MRGICITILLAGWLADAPAQAQPTPRAQAAALFTEARELLDAGKTEAACAKFEEALAIDPVAPGIMLNLGLCYEKLEKYASSLHWYRKAQITAAEAGLPEYEDEAKRHTIELATRVATVRIDASEAPPDVEIRIDGKRVSPTDYARVEVDRGPHTLDARASGKRPHAQKFEIVGRKARTLVIPHLEDAPVGEPPTRELARAPVAAESPPVGRKIMAASFGAVGLGFCIASPLWARSVKGSYDNEVATGETPSWDAARNKQHVATGMFVLGVGLIGLGAYIYLTVPSQTSPTSPALAVSPTLSGNGVGIAVSGSL